MDITLYYQEKGKLVICGRNDMIRKSHTKEIEKNIPNAKLSIVKGNHFIANKRYIIYSTKKLKTFCKAFSKFILVGEF